MQRLWNVCGTFVEHLWNICSFTGLTLQVHNTLKREGQQKGVLAAIKDVSRDLCVNPLGAWWGVGGVGRGLFRGINEG